jgi:hypothetical protein
LRSKTFLIVPSGGNAEKYRTAGQAAADNMTHAYAMLDDKTINTQAQYVIFTVFLLQQWLHEGATLLRYTYLSCFNIIASDYTSHFSRSP